MPAPSSPTRRLTARFHQPVDALHDLQSGVNRLEYLLTAVATGEHPRRNRGVDRVAQQTLMLQYRLAAAQGLAVELADTESQFFSQNGEDGILLYLLALVGFTPERRSVEMCAGDGIECNTANLIVNHGFHGLLVDGGEALTERGGAFYRNGRDTWFSPPELVRTWLTAENANALCAAHGFTGEIDVFSLDLDGIDWWIWKALDVISPRIVVAEFNPSLGLDRSIVVRYDPEFTIAQDGPASRYSGGSLPAYIDLARHKGYTYVGSQRYGFNAFFVRDDVLGEHLVEADPAAAVIHPMAQGGIASLASARDGLDWVEVADVL